MTTSFLFNNNGGPTASFPSGHTAVAFSIITPYAQIYHQPWLYTIPFAVGISRILAQDGHWASDVVAGGFIGWLTADLTNRYFAKSDYGFMIFGDGVGLYGKF
ncbi:phosphatase PAP2 family protein [Acidithiobacillus ferrivorans]|uniref:phosphatase PAP2 family protein n=1 Tax=Acidithiobacillus ferrivorans TaxID=160808 RepID=UPI001D02A275|nr:phosphatase PAP2 family protein [Acidithiobacillus ferrivorans]